MKYSIAAHSALFTALFAVFAFPISSTAANDPQAISKSVSSTQAFNCFDLRKAAQKLPVYATNIANRDVTRTKEGGAYKRVDLACQELFCKTIEREDFKTVYLPGHPDANKAGYVQMPVVNVSSEFAALSAAAAEVRLLASSGACGATALNGATMALVKYDKGADVQSDTFNFTADGRLTSWSRTLRDGSSKSVAFNADGTVQTN